MNSMKNYGKICRISSFPGIYRITGYDDIRGMYWIPVGKPLTADCLINENIVTVIDHE
ncbi:hypothetical protein [Anabaena sp. CCY 0017]|uniref:hypothetical protein n=1 Tax=Anabaena sp. CCY 0017 TaxID=3103866 RepID=UPI0039C5DC13